MHNITPLKRTRGRTNLASLETAVLAINSEATNKTKEEKKKGWNEFCGVELKSKISCF